MGSTRSQSDLSDWVIDGVTLGQPAVDPDTGENVWDHELIPAMQVVAPPSQDPDDQLLLGILGGTA